MRKEGLIVALCLGIAAFVALPEKAYAGVPAGTEDTTYVEVVDNREYSDLVIAQVDDWVNIRSGPSTDTEILGKLYNNSVGHYIEETDGWVKITSGSVTGYVSEQYVVKGVEALKIARDVEITYATVTTDSLNIRSKATTDSSILGRFSEGDELVVTGTEDNFAKVTYNNKEAYVSLDFVSLHTEFVEAESIEEEKARLAAEAKARKEAEAKATAALKAQQAKESAAQAAAAAVAANSSDTSLGQQVVNYALQFVGNPYKYGGNSLTTGTDCGGFTMLVYANFGITLPRTGQRSCGYAVSSLSEAQPGDLIFYSGHVAIYIGNGQIVHASTPSKGICVTSATYASIIAIRRIF